MIPAGDLRKGNWVSTGETAGIVSAISDNKVALLTRHNNTVIPLSLEYNKINAIQLTPALLAQCGFHRHELFPHRNAFHHHRLIFNLNFVGKICEVSYGLIAENVAIIYQRPLFLHQLQNLYYVLTNEELKVEL